MLIFGRLRSVVHLAELHVVPVEGQEGAVVAGEAADDSPEVEVSRAPGLPLALGLATLVHLLLLLALTAPGGMRRGAEAASFQPELWPALQARIVVETPPVLAEPVRPAPSRLENPEAGVAIEQKAPPQKKSTEPEQQVIEQQQEDQAQRRQKQGCLGPEELARLEQARSADMDPQADRPAAGLGIPCVEG